MNTYIGTTEIQWIAIASGTFDMGDTFGDGQGWELPVHKVTLDSFQISKYEVTNAQYAKFLNEYGSDQVKTGEFAGETMSYAYSRGVEKSDETWRPAPGYDNYPVIFVTWSGGNQNSQRSTGTRHERQCLGMTSGLVFKRRLYFLAFQQSAGA